MVSATLFGEGNRQKALEDKAAKEVVSKIVTPSSAPVPVPVPDVPATKSDAPKK